MVPSQTTQERKRGKQVNEDSKTYEDIRAMIQRLNLEQTKQILACTKEIVEVVKRYGDCGGMAIALVGAGLAAEIPLNEVARE